MLSVLGKKTQQKVESAVCFMVNLSFQGMNLIAIKLNWIWIVNCYELQTFFLI